MPVKEYEPGAAFPGVIGRTTDESSPAHPRPLRAAAGAPNVLVIVLDDTSFGQLGCYGSPITPNLDALAAGGLLHTNMHTTALCSPSRSCAITGRDHHADATAAVNEMASWGVPPAHRPHSACVEADMEAAQRLRVLVDAPDWLEGLRCLG